MLAMLARYIRNDPRPARLVAFLAAALIGLPASGAHAATMKGVALARPVPAAVAP